MNFDDENSPFMHVTSQNAGAMRHKLVWGQAINRPKKILFLITKATWGGAQKYVYDLATNLPKEKFEVIVAYGEKGKLAEDLARAGVTTYQAPSLRRDVSFP